MRQQPTRLTTSHHTNDRIESENQGAFDRRVGQHSADMGHEGGPLREEYFRAAHQRRLPGRLRQRNSHRLMVGRARSVFGWAISSGLKGPGSSKPRLYVHAVFFLHCAAQSTVALFQPGMLACASVFPSSAYCLKYAYFRYGPTCTCMHLRLDRNYQLFFQRKGAAHPRQFPRCHQCPRLSETAW